MSQLDWEVGDIVRIQLLGGDPCTVTLTSFDPPRLLWYVMTTFGNETFRKGLVWTMTQQYLDQFGTCITTHPQGLLEDLNAENAQLQRENAQLLRDLRLRVLYTTLLHDEIDDLRATTSAQAAVIREMQRAGRG